MAFRLYEMNFVLLLIIFHRYLYKWLFPSPSGVNMYLKILAFIFSYLFCFVILYPLVQITAFFFTCNYYQASILAVLSYFIVPLICSGVVSRFQYEMDLFNAMQQHTKKAPSRSENEAHIAPSFSSTQETEREIGRFTLLNPARVEIPDIRAPPFEAKASLSSSTSNMSTQTGCPGKMSSQSSFSSDVSSQTSYSEDVSSQTSFSEDVSIQPGYSGNLNSRSGDACTEIGGSGDGSGRMDFSGDVRRTEAPLPEPLKTTRRRKKNSGVPQVPQSFYTLLPRSAEESHMEGTEEKD